MAIGPDFKAGFLALNRFGYGARGTGDDLARAASDPRGFLKAELLRRDLDLDTAALPSSKDALQALFAERERIALARQVKSAERQPDGNPKQDRMEDTPSAQEGRSAGQAKAKREGPPLPQQLFRAEALARFQKVAAAEAGYAERLVHFWSNHFCISASKGGAVRAVAGAFEREAIRPHVFGRFTDMLKAVVQHPAMLIYLDNARSFGPASTAGQNRKRGLNENLAREILELHTMGVSGGYTQADVTSLARIITGWTFAGREGRIGEPGRFAFFPNGHEPGDHRLLGKVYPAGGLQQGERALADLARHPATARHIARKVAAHFLADQPPDALTHRLETVFLATGGDLEALALALLDAEEAWTADAGKIRTPNEFLMAAMRATGRELRDPVPILGALGVMGMPLWQPAAPNGWPDTATAWATPKGMKSRLDVAAAIATRVKQGVDPTQLLETVVGAAASNETRQAIARAETREQGLALLLMSPEFQRR